MCQFYFVVLYFNFKSLAFLGLLGCLRRPLKIRFLATLLSAAKFSLTFDIFQARVCTGACTHRLSKTSRLSTFSIPWAGRPGGGCKHKHLVFLLLFLGSWHSLRLLGLHVFGLSCSERSQKPPLKLQNRAQGWPDRVSVSPSTYPSPSATYGESSVLGSRCGYPGYLGPAYNRNLSNPLKGPYSRGVSI